MAKLILVLALSLMLGAIAQQPTPCMSPRQMTFRGVEVNHLYDSLRFFKVSYDADNERVAMFEEERDVVPGLQLHLFLVLNKENVEYDFNIKTKKCTKSVPRRWRNMGIPPNATFETEYTIGGPAESLFGEEWSDRIPMRQREMWIGVFTRLNCFPLREMIIGPEFAPNDTVTARYYDIVNGIERPDDFIPPPECQTATWALSKRPYFF